MNSGPAVIVNKGGFLSALVKGVFGTIMVMTICGTALGLYGLHMADKNLGSIAQQVLAALPEWQKALPPAIADALNDRRDPEYRKALEIVTRTELSKEDHEAGVVVVEVRNAGSEIVSLLTLRVVVEDESNERLCELPIAVATPLALDRHWRGPLLPGETRRVAQTIRHVVGQPKLTHELTDLRVWNGPAKPPTEPAPRQN